MQRLTADPDPTAVPSLATDDALAGTEAECPVCGEPVRGIASASPGEHRFVGCDHYASARFLRSHPAGSASGPTRVRIGP